MMDEMIKAVLDKVQEDKSFAKRLVAGPQQAREALGEIGIDVPNELNLHFVQQTNNDWYFVLPSEQSIDGAVSDEDMEQIAGGKAITGKAIWDADRQRWIIGGK